MRQQEKLKILPPTLRKKERYISFKVISEEPIVYSDLEAGIWQTLLEFYGELGVSQLNVSVVRNLYDSQNQIGVIRCNNKSVPKVIAGLGLITRLGESRVIFKILKISGTIKSLSLK
ncbi:MAG: ribonuclease P protein component 2 [Candidatus Aenigmarchaeota archaeon]|nr:ribonuclease P protein component 2 [Candidatus Aenigmarchaeota archaeon]